MNQAKLEIARRDFMRAMSDIPAIMASTDSITLQNPARFRATFHDFMNQELELEAKLAFIDQYFTNKIHGKKSHLLLIFMGFLSSPIIQPLVKQSIEILNQKIDMAGYIIQELFTLMGQLHDVISPENILLNEERKEEVARKLLDIFKIGVEGETNDESSLILDTLDSVEIKNLSEELEVKIRAEIQKTLDERAKAAAAKPSRE